MTEKNNERETVALAVLGRTLSEGMKAQAETQRDVALAENATIEKLSLAEQA